MAKEPKYYNPDIPEIPDDEPIFIFRAQDMLAEKYLRMYAEELSELQDADREPQDMDRAKMISDVLVMANAFARHPLKKLPD